MRRVEEREAADPFDDVLGRLICRAEAQLLDVALALLRAAALLERFGRRLNVTKSTLHILAEAIFGVHRHRHPLAGRLQGRGNQRRRPIVRRRPCLCHAESRRLRRFGVEQWRRETSGRGCGWRSGMEGERRSRRSRGRLEERDVAATCFMNSAVSLVEPRHIARNRTRIASRSRAARSSSRRTPRAPAAPADEERAARPRRRRSPSGGAS